MTTMGSILMKRVYEAPSPDDGYRILVDRLWPRGMKKESLPYDLWAKEITPSPAIRTAFAHKAENFPEFTFNYQQELEQNPEGPAFCETVGKELKQGNVTLLYAAKDPKINHVGILKAWIEGRLKAAK